MPPADAYSGAELRIRDKAVQEKHDKELGAQEAKYQRLRHAYDQLSNDYFTFVKRGDNIAVRLGFRSFPELQAFVDVADEQIPYKHLSERVDELTAELAEERRESEAMKDVLVKVHEERDFLLAQLAERNIGVECAGSS
ncbi:hypothetical protein GGX14DRAFT_131573 [Mycena pura]|uniref:Uncharacterized protein n=1 Tax=Mycena pura TaxID=153505 RepID=A0AAD6YQG5_9AGAR|nr:hypothetical protein GGX14DRAFT_131573 [Mycena pura]